MKKLSQNKTNDDKSLPKKMREETTVQFPKMDEYEATNYSPIMSNAEISEAELELETAPKTLDFDQAKRLFLLTRKLQRKMLRHPNMSNIKDLFSKFPWLKKV